MMLKKFIRVMCLVLALCLLTACAPAAAPNEPGNNVQNPSADNTPGNTPDANPDSAEVKTVQYWVNLTGDALTSVTNLAETPFAKKLMEAVGVNIEYIHPASGMAGEQFSLLTLDEEMPDIVEYSWNYSYPGGINKAIADGVIHEIDIKNDAPNLYAYLQEHPEIDKYCKTDDGKYFGFPFIRAEAMLRTTVGPIIRADWLEELNLEVPETIDDWTEMLRAFKENGAESPLGVTMTHLRAFNIFVGAWGIADGLYVDNGVVKYGPAEDAYEGFLTQINAWYEEGLIDADLASIDSGTIGSNLLNGITGATCNSAGGGIGRWMAAATEEGFDLVGANYPVLNEGDVQHFGQISDPFTGTVACITTDAEDYELCCKLLDYAYSEEGHMLFNFGIEGESYEMVDGYPTYTSLITANPDGLAMNAALALYTEAYVEGAFVQDTRYMEQYLALPQQVDALRNWSDTKMSEHLLPSALFMTAEENDQIATISEGILSYAQSMEVKFMTGQESLDNFDAYQEELMNRGLETYLKIYQQAYDRFLSR